LETLEKNNCSEEAVKQACTLNLALCHLKLAEYKECIPLCDDVLATTSNMKAFYRRGAAKFALDDVVDAYCDLSQAAEKAGGPADQMIRDEFENCKKVVEERGITEDCEAKLKTSKEEQEKKLEQAKQNAISAAQAGTPPTAASAASSDAPTAAPTAGAGMVPPAAGMTMPSMPPGMTMPKPGEQPSPDQLKMATDMMSNNPEMVQQSMKMMDGMDADSLASMTGRSKDEAAQMKQAMDMMSNNPDMMKQMNDMMKNLSPQEMESMMKLQGGGPGAAGGPPKAPNFTDPETIKAMETVVGSMTKDPNAVKNMAKAAGAEIPDGSGAEYIIRMLAKCLPMLLTCWRYCLYVKQAAVWLVMSKNGRLLCALLILIYAIWQGFVY